MNTFVKRAVKVAAIPAAWGARSRTNGIFFLTYHKVTDQYNLELDLPYALFKRQLTHLANGGQVISYDEALRLLQAQQPLAQTQFVLTFDDGFLDFYTHVFPLLRKLRMPAILYVTTGFVESGITYPLAILNLSDQAATWAMLAEMHESGLVTLGAHTHTHPLLVHETPAQVIDELARPLELFQQRLGMRPQHFAYPGAEWNQQVEARVKEYYTSAVIGGGQRALAQEFDAYRVPRVAIRRSDGWFFFLMKIQGWLEQEERLYELLKHPRLYQLYVESLTRSARQDVN